MAIEHCNDWVSVVFSLLLESSLMDCLLFAIGPALAKTELDGYPEHISWQHGTFNHPFSVDNASPALA